MIFDSKLGTISEMIAELERVKAVAGDIKVLGDHDTCNRLRLSVLKEDNTSAHDPKEGVAVYLQIF